MSTDRTDPIARTRELLAAGTPGPWESGYWSENHQFRYADVVNAPFADDGQSENVGEVWKPEDRHDKDVLSWIRPGAESIIHYNDLDELRAATDERGERT